MTKKVPITSVVYIDTPLVQEKEGSSFHCDCRNDSHSGFFPGQSSEILRISHLASQFSIAYDVG